MPRVAGGDRAIELLLVVSGIEAVAAMFEGELLRRFPQLELGELVQGLAQIITVVAVLSLPVEIILEHLLCFFLVALHHVEAGQALLVPDLLLVALLDDVEGRLNVAGDFGQVHNLVDAVGVTTAFSQRLETGNGVGESLLLVQPIALMLQASYVRGS